MVISDNTIIGIKTWKAIKEDYKIMSNDKYKNQNWYNKLNEAE